MSQPGLNSSLIIGIIIGAALYWLYDRQMGGAN